MSSERSPREVAHGRFLASSDPEHIWGWRTPAGQLRALRRAALITSGGGLGPGMRVLEIGCGTGMFTEMFAKSGADVVAIDVSEDLLVRARARNLDHDRVRFICGRFEDLPGSAVFDAIVGSSVLHHLDIEPALARMRVLVKAGGRVSFAEPNMLNPQVWIERHARFLPMFRHVSPDETAFVRWTLARLLKRHGFMDVAITPFDWLHPATPSFLIQPVLRAGRVFERGPGIQEFAGSLAIQCRAG